MMFSHPDSDKEIDYEMMKNFKPSAFTDLIDDCKHNDFCYIVCTLDGLMTDFGVIPTEMVYIEPDSFSFQARADLVCFSNLDWTKLQKIGVIYDISKSDKYGLNIAFDF